jgi:hypothetical protein
LFEAGALSKSFETSRVTPILFDLSTADLTGNPLSQFQCRPFDKQEILKLVTDINISSKSSASTDVIEKTFAAFWPDMIGKIEELSKTYDGTHKKKKISTDVQIGNIQEGIQEVLRLIRSRESTQRPIFDLEKPILERKGAIRDQVLLINGESGRYVCIVKHNMLSCTIQTVDGTTIKTLGPLGKPVSLNFWNTAAAEEIHDYEAAELLARGRT